VAFGDVELVHTSRWTREGRKSVAPPATGFQALVRQVELSFIINYIIIHISLYR
jgi:hypothetical protein